MMPTMREGIVIAVAQPRSVSFDVAANALTHAAAIRAASARVVVFPELSLTGYELDAPTIDARDPRLAPIVAACAETGSLALVGAPVQGEAGQRHIALLAVDGNGTSVAYRKTWLGGAEPDRFAPGDGPAVLEVDGWRLGLAICKDTGVPQHASDTASLGIDAYVAGTCEFSRGRDEAGRASTSNRHGSRRLGGVRQLRRSDGRRVHRHRRSFRDLVRGWCRRGPGGPRCRRGGPHDAHLSRRPFEVSRDAHPGSSRVVASRSATLRVRRSGGMADAADLNSAARKGVRVRISAPAPRLVAYR